MNVKQITQAIVRDMRMNEIREVLFRRRMTGYELAMHLGVSLTTVYRDVSFLIDEGVPIVGMAGIGYFIDKGLL